MAQRSPSPAAQPKAVRARSVLVIDGNEEHAILSVTALGRKGFRVSSADSGKEGVRIALAQPFDAIVVGHKLRDSSGLEVLRILADKLPRTPKVFVVPAGAAEAALRAIDSGADAYVVKTPRYTELLSATVEDQIQEAENRRRLEEKDRERVQVITERKTVEEKLSQSEARLRVVLKQAPILLWTTDMDLRVTSATGAGLPRLESLRELPKGLSLFEYFNTRDRDIEPIASHLRALAGESVVSEIEWMGRAYDVHMEPLRTPEGQVSGTIGVAFDVTERKHTEDSLRRSEELLHLIGRATNDVIWDWDLQTDGAWMNENVTNLFGYPAEDIEPTGRWWVARIHPDDRGRVGRSRQDAIQGGARSWASEYRFRKRDGTYATVVDRGHVIRDSTGRPVRFVGSVMDVTKERRAEAIQAAVYRISEAVHAAKNLGDLYAHIHKIIGTLMPATNFYIALYDEKAESLSFPYFVDEEESPPPPQKLGKGLTEYVLRTRRPLLASPQVFEELARKGEVISIGPPSVDWVGAPLVSDGRTVGVIVVQSYTEGVRFTEEDRSILTFVAEQVAMAIEHKRSEDRYKPLFDSNPQPMWVFDRDTLRFLAVNDAAVRHYGYSRDEFLSMSIKDIRPQEEVPRLLSVVSDLNTGMHEAGIWHHRRKDGSLIDVDVLTHSLVFGGREAQLVLANDVTDERRVLAAVQESKESVAALFEASPLGILALDREGKVIVWNPAAERIFGWSAADVVGRPIPTVPPDRRDESTWMREVVLTGGSLSGFETRRRRKDGTDVDVSVYSAPLRDAQGSIRGIMAVFEDVSGRKEMERRLVDSERLATMGQLAGFVAHELNTPLTSISLLTTAVSRRVKDDVVQDKLEKINVERRRASGIIRELLNFFRQRQMAVIETDLRSVVEAAVDQLDPYQKEDVRLELLLGDRPAVRPVDPMQMQEVVLNLLKNSFEATDRGYVRVRIEERPSAFAIVVEDSGAGMSPEVLSHLFEPFFTTKKRGEGIGLGLLLSKSIVASHGGTLEVSSGPEKGAGFTVLLPKEASR